MDYKIVYKSSVERDLKKIDKKQLRHIFDKIDSELSAKPDSFPMLSGKFTGLRKYRMGNYRVIYSIIDESILILLIAKENSPIFFSCVTAFYFDTLLVKQLLIKTPTKALIKLDGITSHNMDVGKTFRFMKYAIEFN